MYTILKYVRGLWQRLRLAATGLVHIGTFVIRQPGGVAGTDEGSVAHDGDSLNITCVDGDVEIRTGGTGQFRVYDSAGGILRFFVSTSGVVQCYDIVPIADATEDLGTSSASWRTLFTRNVTGDAGQNLALSASGGGYITLASTKTDTGDPGTPAEGMIVINTFDNNVKMYADGGWRTLASGW